MHFSVIVTLGPAIMNEKLRTISELGPCIFRLNGAHVKPGQVAGMAEFVRKIVPKARLMLDLAGNKIRTIGELPYPLRLVSGETVQLEAGFLNYPDLYKHVKPGMEVLANDSRFRMTIEEIKGTTLILRSHSDGLLIQNKGVHVKGIHENLPFLFEQDSASIMAAAECHIDIVSLSFVRTAKDVQEVKTLIGKLTSFHPEIFAKIETAAAVDNLGYIFQEVNCVNVDRGDLSTDVGMLKLPAIQERIVESALRAGKQIFLATQFLKNMEEQRVPLIAEIVDLYKTVKSGISGIQLSEETAVGKYPVECVKQVFDMYNSSFSA